MSRRSLPIALAIPALAIAVPAAAQEGSGSAEEAGGELQAQTGEPPLVIDILVARETEEETFEECEEDQDAATISGEIIVCRQRKDEGHRLYDKEEAERRHAKRTAFQGDPKAPDFILDCKEQGMPLGCFTMGGVPEPAYMIDFGALPDTPAGSDADRVGRGLAPRGYSPSADGSVTVAADPGRQRNADELGLPEPLNPSESASPAEEPSG